LLSGLFLACSALWATLVLYGAWLCLRELTLSELEKAPEQGRDSGVEASVNPGEGQ
jgi:hypothetical protein